MGNSSITLEKLKKEETDIIISVINNSNIDLEKLEQLDINKLVPKYITPINLDHIFIDKNGYIKIKPS